MSKNFQMMIMCFSLDMRIVSFSPLMFFKMFTKGLWSVTTISFVAPSVNILVFCRAHTIATSLPSMAAYRDLALEQNLDPTRDTLHPSLQQSRVRFLHVQCFCLSQKPIPLTDQSHSSVVSKLGSKLLIPDMHALAIFSFIKLNCDEDCESQKKFLPLFFSRSRNGKRSSFILAA